MCGRVIAHGGFANRGVNDGIDFLPNMEGLLGNNLMRTDALDRVVASGHFGDDRVVIIGVKPSAIADLAAGFGVERCVVEDDLAGFAGLEFLGTLIALDDSQHFAAVGAGLTIAFEVGFRELLVRGIGRLLGCTFPGGTSTFTLFSHGSVKARLIEVNAHIPNGILNEVQRQSERVVKFKRVLPGIDVRMLRSQDRYVLVEFLHSLVVGGGGRFFFYVYDSGDTFLVFNWLRCV